MAMKTETEFQDRTRFLKLRKFGSESGKFHRIFQRCVLPFVIGCMSHLDVYRAGQDHEEAVNDQLQ
jgi:hypothetical protein